MLHSEFDLRALYYALDEQRRSRGLSWKAMAQEVNQRRTRLRPIALSTIKSLEHKPVGEGDGILQMLLWLRRTPESFVPGMADPKSDAFYQPRLGMGQILRWNTRALFDAVEHRKLAEGLTWAETAKRIPGFTSNMLTNLARGGRIGFPRVMRPVAWLEQPAATFTRVAQW